MKRWQAFLALVVLFLLGTVAGGLGAHLYYARALGRPPVGPPSLAGSFMGPRLERALDLSPEQADQLRRILEENRREAEAMRREMAPRVRAAMARSEERIREILDPEQLERFERMQRRHRRRADRFFGGRGDHRGPPPHPPRPEGP